MNAPEPAATTQRLSSITRVTVVENDTVGALVPGMPMTASTPYLVAVAEMACGRPVKDVLEAAQITVGSRVVSDHLGRSKVGAELFIRTALVNREKKRAASPRSSMSTPRYRSKKS
jgi:predicted thioesterase